MSSRHQRSALRHHGYADNQFGSRHQPIIGQARDMQLRAQVTLIVRVYCKRQYMSYKKVQTCYVNVSQSDMTKVRNSCSQASMYFCEEILT